MTNHNAATIARIALARTHHITKDQRRAEAEARNAKSNSAWRLCGHVHGDAQVARCSA